MQSGRECLHGTRQSVMGDLPHCSSRLSVYFFVLGRDKAWIHRGPVHRITACGISGYYSPFGLANAGKLDLENAAVSTPLDGAEH